MKEQKKKRLIALLLFTACLISGYMLFATSDGGSKQLQPLSRADSLIYSELRDFNIGNSQIRVSSVSIDSTFSRKIYHVGVPYQFSKTQFHAELNNRFYPYAVNTPAKVTFPQEDMNIHLLYRNTVVRSIIIKTDPDLTMTQNRISLLVVFDDMPGEQLIKKIQQLGEPIPIVLKIQDPMQANDYRKRLGSRYNRIIFWLQNDDGQDLISANRSTAISKLNQLQQVLPKAMMLYKAEPQETEQSKKLINKLKTDFVDARNARMLNDNIDKQTFFNELADLRTTGSHSVAIISGNETTLSWLGQKLPELKKAGVRIIPPPNVSL